MKFSIIIPAHNSAGFISRALESIAQQTYKDYELIVVCDACTDKTALMARQFTDKVYEVEYHRDGLARNVGIDAAEGEWILFMDDDDWWIHPFVLEDLNRELGDEDVLAFGFVWHTQGYKSPRGNGGGYWIATWNKCWRRSSIGDTRFSDVEYWSDIDFHRGMMNKPLKIKDWDEPMYFYNWMRPGSITERTTTS